MIKFQIYLDKKLFHKLKNDAKQNGVTFSEHVRNVLRIRMNERLNINNS
jgi:hypothetical protein